MKTRKNVLRFVLGFVFAALATGCLAPGAPIAVPEAPKPAPSADTAKDAPRNAAECTALAQKLPTNLPASYETDVRKQFDGVFQSYHETFRCCFDAIYAPQAPRTNGKVALGVKVDHEGKFMSAEVVAAETNVSMPEVHACMRDVAKTLTYPRPVNDSALAYTRVFSFNARR